MVSTHKFRGKLYKSDPQRKWGQQNPLKQIKPRPKKTKKKQWFNHSPRKKQQIKAMIHLEKNHEPYG